MAELLLKVGTQHGTPQGYRDGDLIAAFNRRRIRCVHAEHLCHVKREGFTSDGYRPGSGLTKSFRELTNQFKFCQVGKREHVRIDQHAGTAELIREPNLQMWLSRRLRHHRHAIFGTPGRAIWYGGKFDRSNATLDKVWRQITFHTGRLESEDEFQWWPMGRLDIRHHLAITVEDFSDERAEELVRPLYRGDELILKRTASLDYLPLLDRMDTTLGKVLDRDTPVRSRALFYWRELEQLRQVRQPASHRPQPTPQPSRQQQLSRPNTESASGVIVPESFRVSSRERSFEPILAFESGGVPFQT